MPENTLYPPEGVRPQGPFSLTALREAMENSTILQGTVQRCDAQHTLHLALGPIRAEMPRQEAISPWISGADRDISILSTVGKQICFTVKAICSDEKGAPRVIVSRRTAQEEALDFFLRTLQPGSILSAKVTHLDSFGAFLDIGCGIIAMLPIEYSSVSRIQHPRDRFHVGQRILAVVHTMDQDTRRFTMTHRELLGTWMENASWFSPGETVRGIVRSVKDYGCFIELTPNLSGLSDVREDLSPGDVVSVYIKSIRPDRMKIKLQVIERLPPETELQPIRYQITDGRLDRWVYSPPDYDRTPIVTDFSSL